MSRVLRWGIVGPGRIAEQFAADIRLVRQARLTAVASRSLQAASEFAARHGGIRAYGSYDELFRDGDVDAVYIATPHNLHAAQARAALAAGKAVLCEKPITVGLEEFLSLRDYAQASDVYLTEGMWTWYLPAIRKAQEWVGAGRIGPVRHVQADFGYPLPYDPARREYDHALAGGCLLEMGIYPVAIAELFMRREPLRMELVRHLAPNGVEDDVAMLFDFGDGRSAALATSFRCKLNNWLYVIGDEGYIAVPDFWRASSCRLFRLEQEIDRFDDGRQGQGFEFEIEAVTNDILAGRRESPIVRADDSLRFQSDLATLRARCSG